MPGCCGDLLVRESLWRDLQALGFDPVALILRVRRELVEIELGEAG